MYAQYKKTINMNGEVNYEFVKQISLFGCRNGNIPRLLRLKTPRIQNEPYLWHLNIEEELKKENEDLIYTFIIDLKPKQNKTNLSLYEVLDVWGYSHSKWTPILLRLGGLFVDADPSLTNCNQFTININEIEDPIYEVLYLDGSVENGVLVGKWVAPPASPTNAALLWPETLKHFLRCIKNSTPDILNI